MEQHDFKNMTLERLAQMIAEGFEQVATGFASLEKRFDDIDDQLEEIATHLDGAQE